MQFLVLLLLMLVCVPVAWPEPPAALGTAGCVAVTGAALGLMVALAAGMARWARGQLRGDPWSREAVLHRYFSFRFYHLLGLFLVYGLTLYVLGWGWVAQEVCKFGPPNARTLLPGSELLLLAPFLAALVLSWACFYDAERALHDSGPLALEGRPFWGRWSYVGFHLRHNLILVFVPVGMLIVVQGVQRLFPALQHDPRLQVVSPFISPVLFLLVFLCLPWILRLILGLQPLPEGELRDRLVRTSRRLNFRCSNLLVWPTRGGVANAMVAGIIPWIRYVIFTDRLKDELTPEELEAVLGHEIGHVKHHHMLYYFGFMIMSMFAVWSVWRMAGLARLVDSSLREDLAVLPFFVLVGAYIFLVFGFLSRRCERQADIYGCRAVSCGRPDCQGHGDGTECPGHGLCPTGIRTFIDALEKVARLNGISRDRPGWLQSWQHSTIARRVEFLQRMLDDPGLEPRFQRVVGLVKWVFLLILLGVLGVLGYTQGWNLIL
jgi:STE24 endopeptidase